MPRPPRQIVADMPLHIVQRGHDRAACFRSDIDRQMYLTSLAAALPHAECALHAYVLMTNHVHLLVTPHASDSAARLTIAVGRRYVRYFNDRHARSGPLWEGRYRSSRIDSDRYFLACCRYIETNPVRAGMVRHPAEYPWSSFRAHVLLRDEPWLTPHSLHLALGKDKRAQARAYGQLFDLDIGADTLSRIRQATRRGTSVSQPSPPRGRLKNRSPAPPERGHDGRLGDVDQNPRV